MNSITKYFTISSENWYFYLIIGLLTYFFLKWIFGKFIKEKSPKNLLSFFSAIIITPFIYNTLIVIFFSLLFYEHHPDIKFNKDKWDTNLYERFEMRKNIVESNILLGKTKKEVVKILGLIGKVDSSSRITYDMGSEDDGLMGIKMHILTIDFKNNHVNKVRYLEFID